MTAPGPPGTPAGPESGLGGQSGHGGPSPSPDPAARVVSLLAEAGLTVAVAESLSGGALTARLVDVPGASAVLRGGVVAYATDLKARLLGVDQGLLDDEGPVGPRVAVQMAEGVRTRLGADLGVSTTGVAGPAPQSGHDPGTLHVALAGAEGATERSAWVAGPRAQVRRAAVDLALRLLLERLGPPERGDAAVARVEAEQGGGTGR